MPSRPRSSVNQAIPLHQRRNLKRSFFAWHTGPMPVTVSTVKSKKRIYVARPPLSQKKNADTNPQADQTSSAGQPHSVSGMPQHTQTQSETRPAEDRGCWVNFCLALGIGGCRTVAVRNFRLLLHDCTAFSKFDSIPPRSWTRISLANCLSGSTLLIYLSFRDHTVFSNPSQMSAP